MFTFCIRPGSFYPTDSGRLFSFPTLLSSATLSCPLSPVPAKHSATQCAAYIYYTAKQAHA